MLSDEEIQRTMDPIVTPRGEPAGPGITSNPIPSRQELDRIQSPMIYVPEDTPSVGFTIPGQSMDPIVDWRDNLTENRNPVNGQVGKPESPTRRAPSAGDAHFPTADEALAAALARHGIDPSTIEVNKMYGKNPNLVGPNGEPWELIQGLDSNGKIKSFQHHANGHLFDDKNEFELPHYHGPGNEHLTYPVRR